MYLRRLEISDVRAIESMVLDFAPGTGTGSPRRWTVLLGENGCGKSTILKAIGLVLAGSEALSDLIGDPDQWIRVGAQRAIIRATIATADGKERELALQINRGERRDGVMRRNAESLQPLDAAISAADREFFVAGYGAFRRPPSPDYGSSRHSRVFGRAAQLQTLFSSVPDLMSLEDWAADLDYATDGSGRNVIADAFAQLLPGMKFESIDKKTKQVMMLTQDGRLPLRALSEGYQVMAAWAGDLLFRMTQTFEDRPNPLAARGVLLIDEMDLHLHPVWKRQFVDFINGAFPELQIIATTHSPLSVQQCGEGELFVVKRVDHKPTLIAFKGDPRKLRLSDLFLSPLIGLETLDSPKTAALRAEARRIEREPGLPTREQADTLRSIQEELRGTTPIAVAEAPGLAAFIARSKTLQSADPLVRIVQAEALFSSNQRMVLTRTASSKGTRLIADAKRARKRGTVMVKAKAAKKSAAKPAKKRTAKKVSKAARPSSRPARRK